MYVCVRDDKSRSDNRPLPRHGTFEDDGSASPGCGTRQTRREPLFEDHPLRPGSHQTDLRQLHTNSSATTLDEERDDDRRTGTRPGVSVRLELRPTLPPRQPSLVENGRTPAIGPSETVDESVPTSRRPGVLRTEILQPGKETTPPPRGRGPTLSHYRDRPSTLRPSPSGEGDRRLGGAPLDEDPLTAPGLYHPSRSPARRCRVPCRWVAWHRRTTKGRRSVSKGPDSDWGPLGGWSYLSGWVETSEHRPVGRPLGWSTTGRRRA